MGLSASDIASGHANTIAQKMKLEAAYENKPNHVRHVENQINYTNAQCEATALQLKSWVIAEVPKMIQQELDKPKNQVKIETKVDEKSLNEAKRKITDMIKSIFH